MSESAKRIIETKYGTFHAQGQDLITEQLISYSAHTRNELSMVLDHIDITDTIIDIGAHIGTYSIPMANKAKNGNVLSIEADLQSYNLLIKNIETNKLQDRISPYHFLATGSKLNYSKGESIKENTGANYYIPSEGISEIKGVDVKTWVATLDLHSIDFIKLDIEGMEYQVLTTLKSVLEKHRPKLYIEIVEQQLIRTGSSPQAIQELLDSIGYKYFVNTYLRNSNEDHYIKTEIKDFGYSKFFDVLALPTKPAS